MVQIYKPYVQHSKYDTCVMTRALGHGNMTHNVADKVEIEIDQVSKWRIVGGSDGLHDVIGESDKDIQILTTKSAKEIAEIAQTRWSPDYIWNLDTPHSI